MNWGVFIPCALFIISTGISILARYQLAQQNSDYQYYYLGSSIFALIVGISFVCLTLKVVEGVAITSDETAFVREAEAVKKALKDIEEEKKPILKLEIRSSLPIHAIAEAEFKIKGYVSIERGYIAKKPIIAFWAPPGFKFDDKMKTLPRTDTVYSEYMSCKIEFDDIYKPLSHKVEVKVIAPSKPGSYKIEYRLYCENFYSDFNALEILVEEPEDLPF